MIFRYITRALWRKKTGSLLLILFAAILFGVSGQLAFSKDKYEALYNSIEVKCNFLGNHTPFSVVNAVRESGLAKDYYVTKTMEIRYLTPGSLPNTNLFITNNISRERLVQDGLMTIEYASGYNADMFESNKAVCIIDKKAMDDFGIAYGDSVKILCKDIPAENDRGATLVVAGSYTLAVTSEEHDYGVYMPYCVADRLFVKIYPSSDRKLATVAEFILKDNHDMKKMRFFAEDEIAALAPDVKSGMSFYMDVLKIKPVEQDLELYNALFPIAVAVACLLGGGIPGLIIIQSAKEAAVMRILGTTKRRTRLTLVLEQLALCLLGLLLGSSVLLALHGAALAPVLPKLALCAGLYFGSCLLATTLCAIIVTRGKALELLQTKE